MQHFTNRAFTEIIKRNSLKRFYSKFLTFLILKYLFVKLNAFTSEITT